MATPSIRIEIAVPDRLVLDASATAVQIPLATGYLGALPGHAPMLAELGTGVLSYDDEAGRSRRVALDGGAAEILGDRIRILADKAELGEEIDRQRASDALDRAQKRLATPAPNIEVDRAQRATRRAQARLAASGEA